MHVEKGRIGQFFLFVGFVLLILFSGAGQAGGIQVEFFCLSLAAFALAIFLIWKDWKAPSPSSRFRSFRKFTQKKAKDPGKKS